MPMLLALFTWSSLFLGMVLMLALWQGSPLQRRSTDFAKFLAEIRLIGTKVEGSVAGVNIFGNMLFCQ